MDKTIVKNKLLNKTCENCRYVDDWDHPHSGSTVKSCKIEKRYRNQGTCWRWTSPQKKVNGWTLDDVMNRAG